MKYTELKKKLETFPLWGLYNYQDLVLNSNFDLYLKPRDNPRVIKLEENEVVIFKSAPFPEIKRELFTQAMRLVFATEKYDCKIPKDVYNEAEKDVPDKYKHFLKYELGLKEYASDISLAMNLIQEQMLGTLIEKYNHIEYEQDLNKLGIKNANSYIDYNPVYSD